MLRLSYWPRLLGSLFLDLDSCVVGATLANAEEDTGSVVQELTFWWGGFGTGWGDRHRRLDVIGSLDWVPRERSEVEGLKVEGNLPGQDSSLSSAPW